MAETGKRIERLTRLYTRTRTVGSVCVVLGIFFALLVPLLVHEHAMLVGGDGGRGGLLLGGGLLVLAGLLRGLGELFRQRLVRLGGAEPKRPGLRPPGGRT